MGLSIAVYDNTEECIWEIKPRGEIDISNAHILKTRLETALAGKKQSITIDLSELSYIDSTGLGVIIGTYSSIKEDGLKVIVINPKNSVKKLIAISGLDKILY